MGALVKINTDGLAKLGQIVLSACGVTGTGKIKDAEAEACVALIKRQAESDIARLDAMDSVQRYQYVKEQSRLNNVAAVVDKAQEEFTEGEQVSPDPVDPDWTRRLFNIIEDVSDEKMQALWAKILAGEVKRPCSYSLRTLETLRNMSAEEANIFRETAKYAINKEISYDRDNKYISFANYLCLIDAGLISETRIMYSFPESRSVGRFRFSKQDFIIKTKEPKIIKLGQVFNYTKSGSELLKLLPKTVLPIEFIVHFANELKELGADHIELHTFDDKGQYIAEDITPK